MELARNEGVSIDKAIDKGNDIHRCQTDIPQQKQDNPSFKLNSICSLPSYSIPPSAKIIPLSSTNLLTHNADFVPVDSYFPNKDKSKVVEEDK